MVVADVTERQQLEAQLRHAQKMESIGRLAGGIAHDFNNMLTAILSHCENLANDLGPADPHHRDVEEIGAVASRAASLTRQLLAFSRREAARPLVLDLNALVKEIERLIQRLIGEDVELITDLEPNLGEVKADPGQIEQLIVNLAVNARDAMPTGGQLIIETRNADLLEEAVDRPAVLEPGSYVVLAIGDTGVGMDRETQARAFEPFFTTKENGRGTGLGLSIVYGIAERCGGHVSVESAPDEGTMFTIYLPRVA